MTIADLFRTESKEHARLFDLALIALGSALVAVAAQIEVPFRPVPVTGQTLAVLQILSLALSLHCSRKKS